MILGRTGRTEFNFPATIAALVVNVALNLILVPLAGDRRRRARPGRLLPGRARADVRVHPAALPGPLRMGAPGAGAAGLGRPGRDRASCCCRPRARRPRSAGSSSGSPTRCAPLASGFFTAEERGWLGPPPPPGRAASPALPPPARRAAAVDGSIPEAYEAERMDEDARRQSDRQLGIARLPRLAAAGEQRLAGVGPVDAGRLAGEDGRGEGAQRVGPGGEDADRQRRGARRGACACRGRGCGGIRRSAAGPRRGRSRAGRGGPPRRRGRRACASRRRRGAWRSRTRRSRRRSRGPCSRPPPPPRGGPAARSTAPSRPRACRRPLLCTVSQRCRKRAPASAVPTPGKRQAQGTGSPSESSSCGARRGRPRVGVERRDQRRRRPGPQLGVLVQQQAVARPSPRASGSSRSRALPVRRSSAIRRISPPSARTASAEPSLGGVVEDEDLALDPGRVGALDRVEAGEQVLAAVRVHDAVGERGRHAGHDNRPR